MMTRRAVVAALVALACTAHAQSTEKLCSSATCFAEGDSECNRSTGTCPPCLYEINGGSYSCYSKENGACPFPDQLADCSGEWWSRSFNGETFVAGKLTSQLCVCLAAIKPTPTPTVKLTATPTPKPSPTPTVTAENEQPATVTPPLIDTPTATASSAAGNRTNSVQNHPKSSSATSPSENLAAANTAESSAMVSSTAGATTTSTPSPAHVIPLDSASGLSGSKPSSWFLNVGVIVAAVAGTAVIALFVTRRLNKRREVQFLETPEDADKQFNLQVDGQRTPPSRGGNDSGPVVTSMGMAPQVGSFREMQSQGGGFSRAMAAQYQQNSSSRGRMMPSEVGLVPTRTARAISNSSDAPSLVSMSSLGSSTNENASQQQQPQQPPPYYAEYAASSAGSSYRSSSNVSASSAAFVYSSNTGLSRPQLTDDDMDTGGSTRVVDLPVYFRTPVGLAAPAPARADDEYDIVQPGVLKDIEHRNTETLVEDGRFYSTFSEADVRAMRGERAFFDSRELEL